MNDYFRKLKLVVPAYLLSILFGLFIISSLRWLCRNYQVFEMEDQIWEFWIPAMYSLLIALLWLRLRFKPIKYRNRKSEGLLEIFSGFSIWVILIMSQMYVRTATAQLKSINNIEEIEKYGHYRNYKIKSFAVSDDFNGIDAGYYFSGRQKSTLNFCFFFVKPILNKAGEQVHDTHKYWYALNFIESMNANISQQKRDSLYGVFYEACQFKVKQYNYQVLDHFECLPNYNNRTDYLKAIRSLSYKNKNDEIFILEPVNESCAVINRRQFRHFILTLVGGLLLMLLLLIRPRYRDNSQGAFF
jgi:hypothetical protein